MKKLIYLLSIVATVACNAQNSDSNHYVNNNDTLIVNGVTYTPLDYTIINEYFTPDTLLYTSQFTTEPLRDNEGYIYGHEKYDYHYMIFSDKHLSFNKEDGVVEISLNGDFAEATCSYKEKSSFTKFLGHNVYYVLNIKDGHIMGYMMTNGSQSLVRNSILDDFKYIN